VINSFLFCVTPGTPCEFGTWRLYVTHKHGDQGRYPYAQILEAPVIHREGVTLVKDKKDYPHRYPEDDEGGAYDAAAVQTAVIPAPAKPRSGMPQTASIVVSAIHPSLFGPG
jgi:hypothetical protein